MEEDPGIGIEPSPSSSYVSPVYGSSSSSSSIRDDAAARLELAWGWMGTEVDEGVDANPSAAARERRNLVLVCIRASFESVSSRV
jgi:hypothetical protein